MPERGPGQEAPELHSTTFRLTYADTDPAGILYFAAWFPWMERVQSEWFFDQGLRHDRLLERFGCATVTRHTEADYLVRVGLFDEIRLSVGLGWVGPRSFVMAHRMHRTDDDVLVGRGSITVVTVDREGASIPIPSGLCEHLAAWHEGRGLDAAW